MLHLPWEGTQNCLKSVDQLCFCCTGTAICVFLNIIIHGVEIWGVRRPNIGTGVVVGIQRQTFLAFPEVLQGAESCCHIYGLPLASLAIND